MSAISRRAALGVLLAAAAAAAAACTPDHGDMTPGEAAVLTGGGSATRGRAAIQAHGCGSCHTIAGVPGATAAVGPPLTRIAERAYVGGVITNTPDNLVRWIRDPKAIDSLTAMPTLGVTEAEARDIAAYLYALR